MRKIYFLLLCSLTLSVLSAQEKESKEEQARREKNVQAGNPFAKFGYKAKVATLSKGKYLEVHDLDSIVIIGSVRYHVDKNQIVGNFVADTTDVYARPIGDTPSRWLSPDPLSEEFTEWSPYAMSFNNPIRFIDPDGRAPMTDYFNSRGNKIGSDGIDDGGRVLVTDQNDINRITNATKNKEFVQLNELSNLSSARVIPNNTVLGEALNVLDRGSQNGGLREESSIVGFSGTIYRGSTGPLPTIDDATNTGEASASLPSVILRGINAGGTGMGEISGTSIHLHPTGSLVSKDQSKYYSFTASSPTAGVDDKSWSSHGFRSNIIVGRLGINTNATITNGKLSDYRDTGAAFYTSGSLTPSFQLTTKAIKNIIENK